MTTIAAGHRVAEHRTVHPLERRMVLPAGRRMPVLLLCRMPARAVLPMQGQVLCPVLIQVRSGGRILGLEAVRSLAITATSSIRSVCRRFSTLRATATGAGA